MGEALDWGRTVSAPVNLRINIAGFAGSSCSLFAAYNPDRDLLLIAKESSEYEPGQREGFLKITNQVRDGAYDALFGDDQMEEAIKAYFDMESLGLLSLSQGVQRHNPGTKIERDGLSDTGMKYRISPDMTSGQVAVMAACLFASRQRNVGIAENFALQMIEIDGGQPERGPDRDYRLVEP